MAEGILDLTDEVGFCMVLASKTNDAAVFLILKKGATDPRTGARNLLTLSNYNSSTRTYQKLSVTSDTSSEVEGSGRITRNGNRLVMEFSLEGKEFLKLDMTRL